MKRRFEAENGEKLEKSMVEVLPTEMIFLIIDRLNTISDLFHFVLLVCKKLNVLQEKFFEDWYMSDLREFTFDKCTMDLKSLFIPKLLSYYYKTWRYFLKCIFNRSDFHPTFHSDIASKKESSSIYYCDFLGRSTVNNWTTLFLGDNYSGKYYTRYCKGYAVMRCFNSSTSGDNKNLLYIIEGICSNQEFIDRFVAIFYDKNASYKECVENGIVISSIFDCKGVEIYAEVTYAGKSSYNSEMLSKYIEITKIYCRLDLTKKLENLIK
jgi:hypothetical protein